MWTLLYNREANNYALDSYPYVEDVLIAIELLALTDLGLLDENYLELELGYYLWKMHQHIVLFQRIVDNMEIRILIIKPDL